MNGLLVLLAVAAHVAFILWFIGRSPSAKIAHRVINAPIEKVIEKVNDGDGSLKVAIIFGVIVVFAILLTK